MEVFCNKPIFDGLSEDFVTDAYNFQEVLLNLRMYFNSSMCIKKKMEVLSLLPKTWKFREMRTDFECSYRLYKKLQKLDRDVRKFNSLIRMNEKP